VRELGAGADGVGEAAHARHDETTDTQGRRQLRLDQAAALSYVLTSPRIAEVLTGPAGSGKTRTLAAAAQAWRSATGGDVIGTATSQQARNVLAGAGIDVAENTAALLGHVPGQRGARGMRQLTRGALVLLDEASMTSVADLTDIVTAARRGGAKVIVAGDQAQLPAVEGGGGMSLLAADSATSSSPPPSASPSPGSSRRPWPCGPARNQRSRPTTSTAASPAAHPAT